MSELKRTVGPVTGAATAGGGLGAAIAQIIVHFWPYLQDVEAAVTVVLTVALALLGGYLIPPQGDIEIDDLLEIDDHGEYLPETGRRAAE